MFRTSPNRKLSLIEIENKLGMKIQSLRQPDELGIGMIVTEENLDTEEITALAAKLGPEILWTEPLLIEHSAQTPNDPIFPQQVYLTAIKAVRAWELWYGDPSTVVVAVLDSGIPIQSGNLCHPDLNDPSRFVRGADLYNQDNDPADDHGHGTHVVGIAAATRNNGAGIAGLWPGPVLILKVFNASGLGATNTFEEGVNEAVKYANAQRIHLIINYSGGGSDIGTKQTAVEYARNNGALIVAAAGDKEAGSIDFPAAFSTRYSNVMAIGGVDGNLQPFGCRGPEMTVVAPGVHIASTLPNYRVSLNPTALPYGFLTGTSQATPLVAALAALVWSQWPNLNASEVRDKIVQSADTILGSTNNFGHGLINAEAALT
jgi:thermitase